jgi:hypothetical protein
VKAITLTQPWATLMAIGEKSLETRSWRIPSRYVGQRVAIHAAKSMPSDAMDLCFDEPFRQVLVAAGYPTLRSLPRGAIVATAVLAAQLRTEDVTFGQTTALWRFACGRHEQAFGNYAPGRFAWVTWSLMPLETPLPCPGRQRFWEVPRAIAAEIEAQERRQCRR